MSKSSVSGMRICIPLAHNYQGSITKLAWMYAKYLAAEGAYVTVYHPLLIDQIDYELFTRRGNVRATGFLYMKLALKVALGYLLGHRLLSRLLRRPYRWVGTTAFGRDDRIIEQTYLIFPSPTCYPDSDLTICMQSQLLPWLLMAGQRTGQMVDSIHTSDYTKVPLLRDWRDYCYKDVARQVDMKRFAVSQDSKDFFSSLGIRIDCIIPNGIDMENFPFVPLKEREKAILMYCDPRPEKGFDIGVEILSALRKTHPDLKFASIGNTKGLDTSLFDEVHGFVSGREMGGVLAKYRYFLFPSRFEGYPGPPLEAMSTGSVCILARTSGIKEYARNRENAMVFPPGDVSTALTCIEELLNNDALCETLSAAGPYVAKNNDWSSAVRRLIDFVWDKKKDAKL